MNIYVVTVRYPSGRIVFDVQKSTWEDFKSSTFLAIFLDEDKATSYVQKEWERQFVERVLSGCTNTI